MITKWPEELKTFASRTGRMEWSFNDLEKSVDEAGLGGVSKTKFLIWFWIFQI